MFTIGAITLGVFFVRFVIFTFQESPKFLVYRGQDEKAVEVLQHIAKVNKVQCGVTLADFQSLTTVHNNASIHSATEMLGSGDKLKDLSMGQKIKVELVRYKMLFDGWQMTRLTILVWLTYIMDFWGFTLAGMCLIHSL